MSASLGHTAILCSECGRPADEHHEFVPRMPDGCQCDAGTWGDTVAPVCDQFTGDPHEYCKTCEHDFACHPKETP